ncbi:MAG: hypothetical protein Q6353_017405, partial [Candidatus Sigynarchaeum springense]
QKKVSFSLVVKNGRLTAYYLKKTTRMKSVQSKPLVKANMDGELKKAIEAGTSLKKVDQEELKKREEEKKKRLEELKALAAKLEAQAPKE